MMSRDEVRAWLLEYAWAGSEEARRAEVECIMAQGAWEHVDAVADQFAGAQEEPGPRAIADGTAFALSALYECHDEPHFAGCPCLAPSRLS